MFAMCVGDVGYIVLVLVPRDSSGSGRDHIPSAGGQVVEMVNQPFQPQTSPVRSFSYHSEVLQCVRSHDANFNFLRRYLQPEEPDPHG